MKHTISVIIPVFNEERYIEKCLESVVGQSIVLKEIIVVDDGSKDKSIFKIQNFRRSQISIRKTNFKLLKQKHRGPAETRNVGAIEATGNVLVFLDADMVYDQHYISELMKPIIRGDAIASFTRSERVGNLNNHWAYLWDVVTFTNEGKRVSRNQSERGRVFRVILADQFRRAHGYASFGSSDDTSVLEKLGTTAVCADEAVCWHFNPETLAEVYYSARWMGRDSQNIGNVRKFFIFSPIWSFIKAIRGVLAYKNMYFLPFRLLFDWGYFTGLMDINTKGIHYK